MPDANQMHSVLTMKQMQSTEIAARLLDSHLADQLPVVQSRSIWKQSAQHLFLTRICANHVNSLLKCDAIPESTAGLRVQGACCQHASLGVAFFQVALKGGPSHCQASQAHPRTHLFQKLLPLPMCSPCCHNIELVSGNEVAADISCCKTVECQVKGCHV